MAGIAAGAVVRRSADGRSGQMVRRQRAPQAEGAAQCLRCHHFIYDSRYPADRRGIPFPGDALVGGLPRLAGARLGIARHVVIQPSTYGLDNRVALAALSPRSGQGCTRRRGRQRQRFQCRTAANASAGSPRHPFQFRAGRTDHPRNDRAAVASDRRFRLATSRSMYGPPSCRR